MVDRFRALVCDERGTTSIEYALIGTLVGAAIIVSLQNFAGVTNALYSVVAAIAGVIA